MSEVWKSGAVAAQAAGASTAFSAVRGVNSPSYVTNLPVKMGASMSDEGDTKGSGSGVGKVAAELAKEAYEDALKPAAQELGKGAVVVAKAVNAALAPLEGFVWGVEKIREFIRDRVAKKLEGVPPENIQPPKPHIGVPVIDALRYTGSEPDLAELYANLLATSMDRETAHRAHPGFVDMIKNMSPDEARIMRFLVRYIYYPVIDVKSTNTTDHSFEVRMRHASMLGIDAGCQHPELTTNYIDNLDRLGLIEVDAISSIYPPDCYGPIEQHRDVKRMVDEINKLENRRSEIERMRLGVTALGRQFIQSCVLDKTPQSKN